MQACPLGSLQNTIDGKKPAVSPVFYHLFLISNGHTFVKEKYFARFSINIHHKAEIGLFKLTPLQSLDLIDFMAAAMVVTRPGHRDHYICLFVSKRRASAFVISTVTFN